MKKFDVVRGVYPTMITPYKNGVIDEEGVRALVRFYYERGCDGIFAVCQSSEIMYLSLEERVLLIRLVVSEAKRLHAKDPSRSPLMIVASGHVSDAFEDQVRELNAIAAEGPDALILISNRMDIANTSDEAWIAETERLIAELPPELPLGVYECPKPYKRLLTDRMLAWCAANGRFYFMKDTCCDADLIARRRFIYREEFFVAMSVYRPKVCGFFVITRHTAARFHASFGTGDIKNRHPRSELVSGCR